MTRKIWAGFLLFMIVSAFTAAMAQSGAIIPQGGAGHANQASCVILKRMGPADQITSHLYSFGLRGKQFQYIEGELPEGFPFHGRLTDHDVRNLQGRGAEVIFLEPQYTAQTLREARVECKKMTEKNPNQAPEPMATPQPDSTTQPANAPARVSYAEQVALDCSSSPPGADIEIDGSFVGNTPSSVSVAPGDHTIKITKSGYHPWERKLKTSMGNVKISPELEPVAGNSAR